MDKITLKKEDSLKEQKKKLHSLMNKDSGLDSKKYSGVITVKEDPVQYQRRIRKEWDESAS